MSASDSDTDDEFMLAVIIEGYSIIRRKKTKRNIWAKQWLQRRKSHGLSVGLLRELRNESSEHQDFKRFSW